MRINDLTHAIIGSAIRVHQTLGPGLLESVYRVCLAYELKKSGLQVGLLINFHEVVLKDGICRIVNNYRED